MKGTSSVIPHWIVFENDWEKELFSREYPSNEINIPMA